MAEIDPLEGDSSTVSKNTVSEPGVIEMPTETASESPSEFPAKTTDYAPSENSEPSAGGIPKADLATVTENTIRAPGRGEDQKTVESAPAEKMPQEVATTGTAMEAKPDFSPASLLDDFWFYSRDISAGYMAYSEARESLWILTGWDNYPAYVGLEAIQRRVSR